MLCFMALVAIIKKKKKRTPLWHNLNWIWIWKSHQADFASELKHEGTRPTPVWLRVKTSIQAEPSSGNQQTNMCRHDSAAGFGERA